ncbi:MAG: SigB/SigF/SigG family RNA polymerase sigma factor [Solirubrobacteraceae bacterium]
MSTITVEATLTQTATLSAGRGSADPRIQFDRWCKVGDRRSQDELITRYLPLAHRLARRYVQSGEPYDDLFQIASLGLVKAVQRFEPSRGFAFTTFAVPTILGELKRYFRDSGWALHVDRGAKERARSTIAARREIGARTGRSPTISELAEYLELSQEEVLESLQAAEAYEAISLDAPARSSEDPVASRLEQLGTLDAKLALVDDSATVLAAAQHLPLREREVIYLRFGEDLSQSEIAERIGISQMHVSRLLRQSLERLRKLTADCAS